MSMKEHVGRYVAHKRRLGRKYAEEERLLHLWADTAMARGEDVVRADTMIRWARQASSSNETRKRLAAGRRLALWLRAEDERNEVPHVESLGRERKRRHLPRLPCDGQIRGLMEAALQLPPAGSITPHAIHCIIGLIAVTGLRRAEACALEMSDVTVDGLTIRDSKFGKSRLVPLSDSTRDALHRYLDRRRTFGPNCDRLFVLSTGRPISPNVLTNMFAGLVRRTGLRGGKGEACVTLRDLRHRFAVRSLEQAIDADRDSVSRHILALSTYMGHVNLASTYFYLHATPVLLGQISETTEALHAERATS